MAQPALDQALVPMTLEPAHDDDVEAVLLDALRDGRGGQMTRLTATFLAGVAARFLMDRMALAGLVVCRKGTG